MKLPNVSGRNRFAVAIQKSLIEARRTGIAVEFAWIKAHVRFGGNEETNEAAKAAANFHKSPNFFSIPIKTLNKQKCSKASNALYSSPFNCAYTKNLLPSYTDVLEYLKHVTQNFAKTQYLTGHRYHRQILYRFKISTVNTCPRIPEMVPPFNHLNTLFRIAADLL